MFLPLHDIAPLQHVKAPWVTRGIMAATVLAFLLTWSGIVPGGIEGSAVVAGMIPAVLFGHAALPAGYDVLPPSLTLVTSLLLHGGVLHLVGNMLFLQVFGDNVEDALGHWRFLAFYILCGIAAGLAHALANPLSQQPLIGASGAVSGVVAAYLVLHPRARVFGLFLSVIPLRVSAYWVLGLWLALQVWHVWRHDEESTAWWAHLGGFAAGLVLVFVLRRRKPPRTVPASP